MLPPENVYAMYKAVTVDWRFSEWRGIDDIKGAGSSGPGRLDNIYRTIELYPDRYIAASVGLSGMNRITFLRGMEQFFIDLYVNRQLAMELINNVFEWELTVIQRILEIPGVDAIWLSDDWGTQKTLMIDPKLWREVFKPLYAKQFEVIRGNGKDVIFHSCGYVYDIIGDLIDIGASALNLNQPHLLGIERLGSEFGGKVCFICPVDMQTTLIYGTQAEIEAEAELLVNTLHRPAGGFIACMDEGIDHGYIPRQRIDWMEAAFRRLALEKLEG